MVGFWELAALTTTGVLNLEPRTERFQIHNSPGDVTNLLVR